MPIEFHRVERFPVTPNNKVDRNSPASLDSQNHENSLATEWGGRADKKTEESDIPQFDLSPSHHIEILMSEIWERSAGGRGRSIVR